MTSIARGTTRGAALGFAIGLLVALLRDCRPDVALHRATLAALVLASVTWLAMLLNRRQTLDDDGGGERS